MHVSLFKFSIAFGAFLDGVECAEHIMFHIILVFVFLYIRIHGSNTSFCLESQEQQERFSDVGHVGFKPAHAD